MEYVKNDMRESGTGNAEEHSLPGDGKPPGDELSELKNTVDLWIYTLVFDARACCGVPNKPS
jgi:hypothetical protein